MFHRHRLFAKATILLLGLLVGVGIRGAYSTIQAREVDRAPRPVLPSDQSKDAFCLECHQDPALKTVLPSGEELPLFVDTDAYTHSVHWPEGVGCIDCHPNIRGYPHPPLLVTDRRDVTIGMYTRCRQCHEEQYRENLDSMHARELAAGNRNAPVCTDCHGAHDVRSLKAPRTRIVETCAKCHSTIYEQYKESVHGSALIGEGNPDVPTCIDCHGVHRMENPLTYWFRNRSPRMCADCHTDPNRMSKYGISTDVWRTYVADFHGTTTELFVKQSPDQPINTPLCIDCHGVHDIKAVTDPEARVVKEHLVEVCRRCHPDATPDFPTAWVGHYAPSPDRYPLVYYVNWFYYILIPLVLGFFVVFILVEVLHDTFLARRCGHSQE